MQGWIVEENVRGEIQCDSLVEEDGNRQHKTPQAVDDVHRAEGLLGGGTIYRMTYKRI